MGEFLLFLAEFHNALNLLDSPQKSPSCHILSILLPSTDTTKFSLPYCSALFSICLGIWFSLQGFQSALLSVTNSSYQHAPYQNFCLTSVWFTHPFPRTRLSRCHNIFWITFEGPGCWSLFSLVSQILMEIPMETAMVFPKFPMEKKESGLGNASYFTIFESLSSAS